MALHFGIAHAAFLRCASNHTYSVLVFKGGAAFRKQMLLDIGDKPGVAEHLAAYTDEQLFKVMTDLGGGSMQIAYEVDATGPDVVSFTAPGGKLRLTFRHRPETLLVDRVVLATGAALDVAGVPLLSGAVARFGYLNRHLEPC